MNITEFQKQIGYEFKDEGLLRTALTHSSYTKEKKDGTRDNERLEFLGDAFLDAIVGVELYELLKDEPEGRLTKTRAQIVSERPLSEVAREIGLGNVMQLGRGEDSTGGRNKDSILADCMEAVIGAVFIDGGYSACKDVVCGLFNQKTQLAVSGKAFSDYKSRLQEYLQREGKPVSIVYAVDREEGPAHDKKFFVHMECDGKKYGQGYGKSKKEAEQMAARVSLEMIGEVDNVL